MGGKPLAMVNIMSVKHDETYENLLAGIKDLPFEVLCAYGWRSSTS